MSGMSKGTVDYIAMIEELNASSDRRNGILEEKRRSAAAAERISADIATRKKAAPAAPKKLRLPPKVKAKPRPETPAEKMARLKAEHLRKMIDDFYNPPEAILQRKDESWYFE